MLLYAQFNKLCLDRNTYCVFLDINLFDELEAVWGWQINITQA